ncbi:MAG: Druantia anti-phage system protein DruA [bacterium]
MENEGIINLPPLRKIKARKEKKPLADIEIDDAEIICSCSELTDIRLEVASAGDSMKRWRWHIDKYHMLGDKNAFGAQIQYFIMSGTRELGCIQFSASSWALAERDCWIGWGVEDRKKRLHLIINNSRFLIFPWVKVKNLASHILSIVVKQIRQDWLNIYCYEPVLLETFVDTAHFAGTIYKASNWIHLGETQGRGRQDRYSEYKVSKKAILMYPLKGDFRKYLRGEKEYKKVVDE